MITEFEFRMMATREWLQCHQW